ncbi:hybrid sensor histidine kinase/response regulator [Roseococcus sp. SYP-B2431]|uniref:hybrid sensor histidine kinase/response regulator n=1 Tax=Roseococcus sp. SYP-B2431 TaxID=2496640 RepID=UPI00103FF773|nr:chemotaxis protein CheW [Roseococcus sp. SYP-B2431]TCH97841.1 hybrid sensor histidine kinase/response regulator [Roseococcus sp. SYP-B2431]
MDDLLADFLTETNEGLASLDAALLQLERNPANSAVLSEVFRTVHTIKGTCGFLGLPRLEGVAHAAENVLGLWRDGTLPVTRGGVTLILSAADRIKQIVAGLEAMGSEPAGDDAPLKAALDAAAAGEAPPKAAVQAEARAPVAMEALIAAEAPAAAPPDAAPEISAGGVNAPQTIRVAVDVLEDLMVLVSELVLTRNQLLQLARSEENAAFAVPLQRLSQITSDLQDGVMKTRMQPIGNAWAKLPRLVRDLSNDLGKRIELDMRGADTELDRQVMELIKDPLTHMVRNSADHGLETPEQRRAGGKSETGRILLNAFHEGGHIVLEIGDDGRGLNTERIKAKVVAQGLATEAELATMSDREIHRFIFRAGFSTAAEVTSVSGRGVGMDVVKTNIERIGGIVDLRSREHRGTTFTIKIPLTLAIAAALIVEAGGERFAIPQAGVLELVRVGSGDGPKVELIKEAPVLRLRDQLLPLIPLKRLLRLETEAEKPDAESFVVVTQLGSQLFGIVVDRVFDTEEIVVKPVAPILRHITIFSGNTILGDGSVIMILDPSGIARATGLGVETAADNGAMQAQSSRHLGRHTSLLLFRAGEGAPKAVPLSLVARLENLEAARIERAGDSLVVQYRGSLMPLVPLHGLMALPEAGSQAVLVFGDGVRAMGLMVDEILDVVDASLDMDTAGVRPGFLGSCVVAGKVTEILDTAFWLKRGQADWFEPATAGGGRPSVLIVEDSGFFRNLIVPSVIAAGFDVTTVVNGREALRLRDAGERFDVIVSDINMPELDGFGLARAVREGGIWADLPMIALSGRSEPRDVERGRAAGFSDYIAKFDREALLTSLQQCLQPALVR